MPKSHSLDDQRTVRLICAALFIFALLLSGCESAVEADPQIAIYRSSLLINSEPEGAVTIEDARAKIDEMQDVVLIARVGNRDIDQWWSEDEATLVVSEGFPDSHYNAGPDHDPKECPFCRSRWKNEDSMAFVRFTGDDGNTFPADARKILNVDAEDFIVVKGTAHLDDDSMLHVDAGEVFVRAKTK